MKQISMERLSRGRLKLRQLWLLVALAEFQTLRRAAEQYGITQPAATRMLRELEEALGVPLFERSRRGMKPTLYGEAMIRHARVLLADLNRAGEEVVALAGGASGRLSIGTLISTAPVLLPRSIARLKAERPRLRILVQEGTHGMLVAALRRGELDVMLGRVTSAEQLANLRHEVLYREEFRIVAGPRHPLARARRLSLADLVDEAWVLPQTDIPLRQRLDVLFIAQAGRAPENFIESVSLLTNLTLLQQTRFLATMPAEVARHFARYRLISVLPVLLKDILGPVAIITRAGPLPSPAVEAFISAIKATVEEMHDPRTQR